MRISINRLWSSHGRGGLEGDRPSSTLDQQSRAEVQHIAAIPFAFCRSWNFSLRYCLSAANQLTDYVYDETGLLREILSKYRGEEKVDRKIAREYDALDRLIRNFLSRMDEDRMAQVEESDYSLREILTIASLIEEETDGTDQANIASVIYNRLEGPGNKQGTYGLLQIDASLLYALPDHSGPITSADMQTDSPYNLYQNAGLPPTPISNPGLASIDAALNPNSTEYYYYALGTDGKHHFSTTLAEHNAFVNSSEYGG